MRLELQWIPKRGGPEVGFSDHTGEGPSPRFQANSDGHIACSMISHMLPPYIIEKLREREAERERQEQPQIELEMPRKRPPAPPPEESDRGVIEIPIWG